MTESPPGYKQFFAELKRRKVFRVAAVYGVTAFVVVQAADLVFRALEVPPWALTITVTLALLGFPVALVLAWAFEATPEASDPALATLIERYERHSAIQIAMVVAHRGEVDRAFRWLDGAVEYGDPGLSEILVLPEFDALEEDPRWPAFLERIGMAPEDLDAIEFEVDLPGTAAQVTGGS